MLRKNGCIASTTSGATGVLGHCDPGRSCSWWLFPQACPGGNFRHGFSPHATSFITTCATTLI